MKGNMVIRSMVDADEQKSNVKLPCLVADSAAFMKNVDLHNIAEKVFTLGDVINEIKDAATKQRLAVLQYEIIFREPSAESLKSVSEFAKKTGDFKSLSAVDLRVLGLTHQLEKEFCDAGHINNEPYKKVQIVERKKMIDKEIAGFYSEKRYTTKNDTEEKPQSESENQCIDKIDGQAEPKEIDEISQTLPENKETNMEIVENDKSNDALATEMEIEDSKNIDNYKKSQHAHENKSDEENEDLIMSDEQNQEQMNDVDEGGWITPSNIKSVKEKMGYDNEEEVEYEKIKCACLTTDFAMQNVLIQMGLHVLSVNGMLIKQARSYLQKCFGCYKETSDMERFFCPSCGNKTLMKVAVTIADDGTIQYHYPKRKRNFNIRGTKDEFFNGLIACNCIEAYLRCGCKTFSIPAPKGGRQTHDVLLVEDQKTSQTRLPKKRDQINPLDPDYVTRGSPFAMNDTNSRAFALGHHIKHTQHRNPNATKKKKSGRKK